MKLNIQKLFMWFYKTERQENVTYPNKKTTYSTDTDTMLEYQTVVQQVTSPRKLQSLSSLLQCQFSGVFSHHVSSNSQFKFVS